MKLTEAVFKTTNLNRLQIKNYRDIGYKHKVVRVPALKDQVQGKGVKAEPAQCVKEMVVMMDCWKAHDFNQSACLKEMSLFQTCMAAADVISKEHKQRAAQGLPSKGSGLRPSKQVNQVLSKYPQPATDFKWRE